MTNNTTTMNLSITFNFYFSCSHVSCIFALAVVLQFSTCWHCWKQEIAAITTSTWRDERTGTTRKNACDRETMRMMKIRAVIIFIIAQVVLAKEHTSGRSTNIVVEDRAIRHNRNIVTNSLSNRGLLKVIHMEGPAGNASLLA